MMTSRTKVIVSATANAGLLSDRLLSLPLAYIITGDGVLGTSLAIVSENLSAAEGLSGWSVSGSTFEGECGIGCVVFGG